MAITLKLDLVMADRKIRLKDLAEQVGITLANLSNLKNGKSKALRLSTLDALCHHLECEPGDLIQYTPEEKMSKDSDYKAPEISLPSDFLD